MASDMKLDSSLHKGKERVLSAHLLAEGLQVFEQFNSLKNISNYRIAQAVSNG